MIRLSLTREPAWLELGYGVTLRLRPLTTALVTAARRLAQDQVPGPLPDAAADPRHHDIRCVQKFVIMNVYFPDFGVDSSPDFW